MGKIVCKQSRQIGLRRGENQCPNCGSSLLMFGCDNPRCENYHENKRFFYHEIIKTQKEIDKEFKAKDKKKESLNRRLECLEAALSKERERLRNVINNIGWGTGMRCTKCTPSFKKEDELLAKIKNIKTELAELN